jgi:hypothetical protein
LDCLIKLVYDVAAKLKLSNQGIKMRSTLRISKLSTKWAFSMAAAAVLVACGGSPTPAVQVSAATTTATISGATPTAVAAAQAVVTSVLNQTFTYTTVPAFGTTAATTVVLSGTGAAPIATIVSAGKTAKGVLSFGSCIFTITQSDFVAPSPLAVGTVTTVTPCALDVQTAGTITDGTSRSVNTDLVLGTVKSANVSMPVVVSPTGTVTIGGQTVGTTPIVTSTGATGGG